MQQALSSFFTYLEAERNVSPHTLAAYKSDLAQFCAFVVKERGEAIAVDQIDHLLLRRYLALLHKDRKKSSIGRKLAAIRAWFKYLLRTGIITTNPAELVSTPRQEKKLPYHLTIDEVTTLVEAPAGGDELSLRDRAIQPEP